MRIETIKMMKVANNETREIRIARGCIEDLINEMKVKKMEIIKHLPTETLIEIDDLMLVAEILSILSDGVSYFEGLDE